MNVRPIMEDANTAALTQMGHSYAAAEMATNWAKMENLVTVRFQKINKALNFTKIYLSYTSMDDNWFHVTIERADLITGAAVGGTLGILIITILLVTLICVYITHLRRAKGTDENDHHHYSPSKKRQMKHEISLPYVVENKSFSNTLPNTRGPKILVLNATTPDNTDGTNKNLEVYNSLFDSEEVAEMNSYTNGDTIPTWFFVHTQHNIMDVPHSHCMHALLTSAIYSLFSYSINFPVYLCKHYQSNVTFQT